MQPSIEKGQSGPFGRVEPPLPQVFGRYLLVQRLSRGGMGEIFLAKHGLAGFEKLAVIKKVLPHLAADAQFISRFVDEAQVAIKLQHVNIAQVFEVGRVGDEYFLALEYVEGRDLRRTLGLLGQRKTRLPVDLALFIGRELANGLAYAHRRTSADGASLNLVHCDISPPNVLVSFEGETKVIDFGIAKSAIRGTVTDPKMGFGKFGYMAPEQLIRGGTVDHRTDIYAAGVVLYELLTGKRLYEAGPEPDYRALAKKVAKGEHDMPSELDRVLAPYDDLVATALRPKQEDRYQSAAELRDSIQQCLVAVNPTISTDQLGSFMRDLFSEEMTAQKELHDRIAKAHLDDFKEQLTTQTGTTVSFAFANLPLQAPPEPPPPPRPPVIRAKTADPAPPKPRAPTAPTDMLPHRIPATQGVEIDLLADGTGAVHDLLEAGVLRPRRGKLFAVLAIAMVVVVGGVYAMTRPSSSSSASAAAGKPVAATQVAHVTVAPIPPSEQDLAPGSATIVAIAGSATVAETGPGAPTAEPAKTEAHKKPATEPAHVQHHAIHHVATLEPRHEPLTRDAVAAKLRAVKHEYDLYKAKNGGRLENEWNDLEVFMNFQLRNDNLDEASRRIDAFRAKMKD
ncbi:MAG TPA: serine/threonine-protein kinase [Kofleriaceae bacterium]